MEDAIKKILDMLEAGKISLEEAEKLIRAVKETGEREGFWFPMHWRHRCRHRGCNWWRKENIASGK